MATAAHACCCSDAFPSCCDAWAECPETVRFSFHLAWSKTGRSACDASYVDPDSESCTIPADTEVMAETLVFRFHELTFRRATDAFGCAYYELEDVGTADQPGRITLQSSQEGLACSDCDGADVTHNYCGCTVDIDLELLDGTVPDQHWCLTEGRFRVQDMGDGTCRGLFRLAGTYLKVGAMDSTAYDASCVASGSNADAAVGFDIQLETDPYSVMPCPHLAVWKAGAMAIHTMGVECDGYTGGSCSSEEPTIPLTTPCTPCPADVTCETAPDWPCYDYDYTFCGIVTGGVVTDAALCYQISTLSWDVSL